MKKNVQAALVAVVGQIINMYNNNVLAGNGNESFTGWCEDGEVFDENQMECRLLMMRLAPHVDALTNAIVEVEEECKGTLEMTATQLLTYIEENKEETLAHLRKVTEEESGEKISDEDLEGCYRDTYAILQDRMDEDYLYVGETALDCLEDLFDNPETY